jgi:hypothetical protein
MDRDASLRNDRSVGEMAGKSQNQVISLALVAIDELRDNGER